MDESCAYEEGVMIESWFSFWGAENKEKEEMVWEDNECSESLEYYWVNGFIGIEVL